jgi:hypothetical protein
MKNYIIVLMPEKGVGGEVEEFRKKNTGLATVDGLLPHVSLVRRFVLRDNFNEN